MQFQKSWELTTTNLATRVSSPRNAILFNLCRPLCILNTNNLPGYFVAQHFLALVPQQEAKRVFARDLILAHEKG